MTFYRFKKKVDSDFVITELENKLINGNETLTS